MVLGNLTAENIVVGGQELYVSGDLRVNGLFWGDYNHGDLQVMGEIHANAFMATNEYHYDTLRFDHKERVFVPYYFIDDDEDHHDYPNLFTAILKSEFLQSEKDALYYGDGIIRNWVSWIKSDVFFDALAKGETGLLNTPDEIENNLKTQERRTPVFPDKLISVQNLVRLTYPPYFDLMKEPLQSGGGSKVEIWDNNDVFYRISYIKEENHHSLYIQTLGDDYLAVYLEFENSKTAMYYRKKEGSDLLAITTEHKAEYAFFQQQWERFQSRWEEIIYQMQEYHQAVNQDTFNEIFYGEGIRKIYDEEKDKEELAMELDSRYNIQMYKTKKGKDRISIIDWYYYSGDEEDKNPFFYHYEWDKDLRRVVLKQQDGNGEEFSPYEIDFSQIPLYRNATRLFKRLKGWFGVD